MNSHLDKDKTEIYGVEKAVKETSSRDIFVPGSFHAKWTRF